MYWFKTFSALGIIHNKKYDFLLKVSSRLCRESNIPDSRHPSNNGSQCSENHLTNILLLDIPLLYCNKAFILICMAAPHRESPDPYFFKEH
jgi:hypothetical protein